MSEEHITDPNAKGRGSLEKAAMQDEHMQDVHAQLMREKEEPQVGLGPLLDNGAYCFRSQFLLDALRCGYRPC